MHMSAPASMTFLVCVGTRPEIIKMAMLYRLLRAYGHRVVVMHTGQHEEVAQPLYRFFGMPPDIVLDLKRKSGCLADLTAALLEAVERSMDAVEADVVMVQGDTTSALVGALVAYYHRYRVAHIEAGLRTYGREPFPEEKNRELIGRLAHWHFAPTPQARLNLIGEGIAGQSIYEVGNTVIDATLWTRDRIAAGGFDMGSCLPGELRHFLRRHEDAPLILVTAHRRENWGGPIRAIAAAVASILARHRRAVAIWPVHPNPAVLEAIEAGLAGTAADVRERIALTPPLEYPAMIDFLARARLALTDSGGIQEEASALGTPVLVARASTERQELIDQGGGTLVGTETETIVAAAAELLVNADARDPTALRASPFGDGHAAARIARILSSPP
jgi:UDP-N-acetylglucosamine 2-epimerase